MGNSGFPDKEGRLGKARPESEKAHAQDRICLPEGEAESDRSLKWTIRKGRKRRKR